MILILCLLFALCVFMCVYVYMFILYYRCSFGDCSVLSLESGTKPMGCQNQGQISVCLICKGHFSARASAIFMLTNSVLREIGKKWPKAKTIRVEWTHMLSSIFSLCEFYYGLNMSGVFLPHVWFNKNTVILIPCGLVTPYCIGYLGQH